MTVVSDDFAIPDDLSEILGPAPGYESTPPVSAAEPRRPPAVVRPGVLGGVPGASSRCQLERGRLLFGRRLSIEQRALREQAMAEETVGKAVDRLVRVGARVLHDRHAPVGHGQVDHIVINGAGVHLLETLRVSDKARLWVDDGGAPRVGQLPLRHQLEHLGALAGELAAATNAVTGWPRGLRVYPVVVIVGGPQQRGFCLYDTDLVSLDLAPAWVSRLPAVHDALDIAALAEAVAQVCPPHQSSR